MTDSIGNGGSRSVVRRDICQSFQNGPCLIQSFPNQLPASNLQPSIPDPQWSICNQPSLIPRHLHNLRPIKALLNLLRVSNHLGIQPASFLGLNQRRNRPRHFSIPHRMPAICSWKKKIVAVRKRQVCTTAVCCATLRICCTLEYPNQLCTLLPIAAPTHKIRAIAIVRCNIYSISHLPIGAWNVESKI